ncbi:MAG TPA: TIM44-like domain-containing protein, partial [Halothiobacillus sp.]|nr:TIM44-like domain-containing protein [Halothiobacillus sp.]
MFTKKITVLFTVALMSLGLLFALGLQTAEAKRIGSGGSMGQQKQSFSREATPPAAANPGRTAAAAAAPATAGGASKWLGPLAGLAAGGLLAAMFFGGAFDGLKPMDFLLIVAFAIGAFLIFRALRKPATPASSPYATAGAPDTNPIGANSGRMNAQTANTTGYSPDAFMRSSPAVLTDEPQWFDEQSFVQGAKNHFTNLQKHWDSNELNAMREYFTPELFTELAAERARIGNENNVTDVQNLDAQLLDLSREQNFVVASVLFQGQVRENYGQPEAIAEIWHVRHAADTAQGDWLISGIQQYNQV